VVRTTACEHSSFTELEDEQPAARRIIKVGRERTNTGVLVAKCKPGLPLVRGDEIEALEVSDVAPTARHLTVGDTEAAIGQRLHQLRDGAAIEEAVAEIGEHHGVGGHVSHRPSDVFEDLVGYRAIIQRIHLQEPIAADDDRVLVDRRPRAVDHRVDLDIGAFEIVDDEISVAILPEHGRKGDAAAGGSQMLCHDPGPANVVDLTLEQHAHGGRLGVAPDHGAMGVAVHDGIADDVDLMSLHRVECSP
jgi:hypothetical protein